MTLAQSPVASTPIGLFAAPLTRALRCLSTVPLGFGACSKRGTPGMKAQLVPRRETEGRGVLTRMRPHSRSGAGRRRKQAGLRSRSKGHIDREDLWPFVVLGR